MTVSLNLQQIEAYFHRLIPITQAMGVRVAAYDGQSLTLEAPLALNHNHLGTAFGGSLNTLATLAAYGWVWLELQDPECHVVVAKSAITYRRPVRHEIRAVCSRPDASAVSAFRESFTEKGRGRIDLAVTIADEGILAVEFTGRFVATSPHSDRA